MLSKLTNLVYSVIYSCNNGVIWKAVNSYTDHIKSNRNRMRVCDFLLVRHSNLGPILHRFRDIAGFCAHDPTPIPP